MNTHTHIIVLESKLVFVGNHEKRNQGRKK